jgi:hypothetical protein
LRKKLNPRDQYIIQYKKNKKKNKKHNYQNNLILKDKIKNK